MSELPIVCTLSPTDLQRRRAELLSGLIGRVASHERIADGVRLQFAPSSEVMSDILQMIDAERQCCRFLRFELTVESDLGPIWLEITGPAGTADFLSKVTESGDLMI